MPRELQAGALGRSICVVCSVLCEGVENNEELLDTSADSGTRRFLRMLWSGSSKNQVPIARLHNVQMSAQNRSDLAYAKIKSMIGKEIRPLFADLMQADFSAELQRHINVNAFSVEGDQLHQMVDCVVPHTKNHTLFR